MSTRVAIVGAGAAGLLTAKRCLDEGSFKVTVFEQTENVGGTWVYSSEINVHSSMYETMSTNIPKQIMFFPDAPLPEDACEESFVSHQVVRKYLEEYAAQVMHVIKFGHKVVKVDHSDSCWKVSTRSNDEEKIEDFDVVFVCNGHYSAPSFPKTTHEFKGRAIHSHNYRKPDIFRGETVAIVGAGFSGMDIALQVADEAAKIYLLHRNPPNFPNLPSNIEERQSLKDVTPDGKGLLLRDDSTLEDVDTVIYCTGYNYAFPFLDAKTVEITENGKMVTPLFLHVAHRDHPTSLFFIGIPFYVIPFVLFDYQVRFALSVVQGTTAIAEEELRDFEEERMRHVVKKYDSRALFHLGGAEMFDLLREYARRGGFEYSIHAQTGALFQHVNSRRNENVVGYKGERYDQWFD